MSLTTGLVWLAAIGANSEAPTNHIISVASTPAGECVIALDGVVVPSLPKKGPSFPELPKQDTVQMTGFTTDIPWKCIGSAIYAAQRAGYPLKLSFIAEPPPESGGDD